MTVRVMSLSAYIGATFTERIFMKCDTGYFFTEIYRGKLEMWLKLDICVGRFTEDLSSFMFFDRSMKYFVARKECEEIPLLRFYDNTQRFCIVDSYV